MLIPVNSPRVPPMTASCSLNVIRWTLFVLVIVLIGDSTDTIEMYFCTYSLQEISSCIHFPVVMYTNSLNNHSSKVHYNVGSGYHQT